jgi:hypothetical protein
MAHNHSVYDSDTHFEINAVTRAIKNVSSAKTVIVQYDHNSEVFTFELDKIIEGHDMSLCDKVEVHYLNVDSTSREQNKGVYAVKDLHVSPDNPDKLLCSWTISQNATKFVGALTFIVRFACTTANKIDYAWNTAVCNNVVVSTGMDNGDVIVDQYADILETWYMELVSAGNMGVNIVEQATQDGIKRIQEQSNYVPKVATRNLMTLTFQNAVIDNGNFTALNSGVDLAASPDYIEVTGGETYTLSWVANATNGNMYVHEYDADKVFIKDTSNALGNSPFTLTLDSKCSYIRIHFYTWVTTPWEDIVPNNFQIELGTEATEYVMPVVIDNDVIDAADLAKRMQRSGAIPKTEAYLDTLPSSEQLHTSLWEEGAINASGETFVSAYRLRTKGYIQMRKGDTIATTKYTNMDVFEYDLITKEFISDVYVDGWKTSYTVQNDCFIKVHMYWDETTPIETMVERVIFTHNTDTQIQLAALPLGDLKSFSEKVIEDKINEKDVEKPIPVYYFENDYLKNKVDVIRNYISASNGNYDVFVFCTDMHWTLNAKNSPHLINYLASKIHINRLFTGGDLADGINMDVIKELNTCFKGTLYNVSGNHEYFDRFEEDGEINYSKTITGGDVWQYLDGQMTDAVVGNASKNYYYVDNITQKMRYIVLASFTENLAFELGTDQETWLRDTALNIPEGYTAIIFTHSMGTENTANNTLTIHGAGTTVANICDASNANIACIIAGHTHVDIMTKTPTKKIPIFVTTCDKYSPWIDNGVDQEPWLSNRVEGTITEQAFDVFIVDKTNRQINAVRIGCPATDGTTSGLEVRTQTY